VHTRECLAIEAGQRLSGEAVVEILNRLRYRRGAPQRIYCDNVLPIEVKFFGNKAAPGSLNAAFRSYIVDLSPADSA
jgi:hypothetical protein